MFIRSFSFVLFAISLVFSTGCMHKSGLRTNDTVAQQGQGYNAPRVARPEDTVAYVAPVVVDRQEIKVTTSIEERGHLRSDIFYVNEYGAPFVKKWEDYFTGRGRRHMEKYLNRLPRYEAMMKQILREEGVPEELIYIALIESGFNSSAHSSASAVGYWQFIRGTGKYYGLKQNWLVDERRDPIYSTRSAAQYFKALYHAFGSWHLAMSSYNAGEHRVLRAIMGNVSREFWDLHKKKQLPRETRDYVPKFIAAAKIASNPQKYGFVHVAGQAPFSFETIRMNKGVSLSAFAKNLGVSTTEIKRLNPTFKTDLAPVYEGKFVDLRVPVGKGGERGLLAAKKSISTQKYYASTDYHKVRRGDNLSVIAKRHRTSVSKLKRLNGLTNRSVLYPGMRIKLPGSSKGSSREVAKSYSGNAKTYKVRRGDNLWTIAKKFGVSVRSLKRINNLYSSKLRIGQVLKLQNSDGASKSRGAKTHYVKRGENLTRIARKYRVSLSSLLRTNNMTSRSVLKVGTRLRIPN